MPLKFNPSPVITAKYYARFCGYVDRQGPDDCWLWKHRCDRKGYGRMSLNNLEYGAHRISYEIHFGPIPHGMLVCHDCPTGDNPSCVNPAHLFLGTSAQNTHDMFAKGRGVMGSRSQQAKLTETQVAEILERLTVGDVNQSELAAIYGVSPMTVSDIVRGKTWKHVTEEAA